MGIKLDLTGQRFGRLLAMSSTNKKRGSSFIWELLCDCGSNTFVSVSDIKSGHTQSCGCLGKERRIKSRVTHGHSKGHKTSTEYRIWCGMCQRVRDKKQSNYKYYGGRGIKVCKRWLTFENFLEDMGKRPANRSLDRINNNKNYCKENCRWATLSEQARNKRTTKLISYQGEIKTLADWAESFNIKYDTLHDRLKKGWSIEKSLIPPLFYLKNKP